MKPSTELTVIATDADGVTKTLGSSSPAPDRPRGIQFGTQLGSGFYTGSFNVARRIDRDNPDLRRLDDVKLVGQGGDSAYEGYITDLPRSLDDTHTLGVSLAGWMGHAADEPFTAIFVDRDLRAWGPVATNRRVDLLTAGFKQVTDPSTSADQTGRQALNTRFTGPAAAYAISCAMYDAGPGNNIGRITATWTRDAIVSAADTNWVWRGALGTDDRSFGDISASLLAAGPGQLDLTATGPRRFAFLEFFYLAALGGADGTEYGIAWSDVALYDLTVPLLGASAPYGVAASDVIKYLAARYCPLLNTRGVQQTTYPIAHLTFRDDTKVYDAFTHVNDFHLWQQLAVWEDRTLHYAPIDLDDWDWEIRHDEAGNQIGLQGDSIQNLRNGIIVTFTNAATGVVERLHPSDYAELRDDSIENPYNLHGRHGYGDPYTIPWPTTRNDALQLGRVKLAEDNQATGPGSFTCQHHVRDRAGNWQPAWKVRAGDRIRLTSSKALSDRPRLIHETSYNHDSRTITIAVDTPLRYLEGYIARVTNALLAHGLT